MPETPFQRFAAIALLISSALLIVLAVREASGSDKLGAAEPIAERVTATSPQEARVTQAEAAPVETAPATKPKPRPAPRLTRLQLLASGGDSWLDVRAGSAQGKVLYAGTLPQGGEVDVKAKQLWIRFGGASDLTAELNGKPLELRAGTYNALITPDGLQLVAG